MIRRWLRQYLGIDSDIAAYNKSMEQQRAAAQKNQIELVTQLTNQFAAHEDANRVRVHRGNLVAAVLPVLLQHELMHGAWKHLCDESINAAVKNSFHVAEVAITEHMKCK